MKHLLLSSVNIRPLCHHLILFVTRLSFCCLVAHIPTSQVSNKGNKKWNQIHAMKTGRDLRRACNKWFVSAHFKDFASELNSKKGIKKRGERLEAAALHPDFPKWDIQTETYQKGSFSFSIRLTHTHTQIQSSRPHMHKFPWWYLRTWSEVMLLGKDGLEREGRGRLGESPTAAPLASVVCWCQNTKEILLWIYGQTLQRAEQELSRLSNPTVFARRR